MNARIAKEEMALLMPGAPKYSSAENDSYARNAEALKNRNAPRGGNPVIRLARAIRAWLAEQRKRQAMIDELATMTDHELADIGLNRSEVPTLFDSRYTTMLEEQQSGAGFTFGRSFI